MGIGEGRRERQPVRWFSKPVSAVGTRAHPHEGENCLNRSLPEGEGAGGADIS